MAGVHVAPVDLAKHSGYAKDQFELFRDNSQGNSLEVLVPQQIDAEALQAIVEALYAKKIKLNLNNIESILHAASFLQMSVLEEPCARFFLDQVRRGLPAARNTVYKACVDQI